MNATTIIAIGNELLAGEVVDTNSPHLAAAAFAAGFPVQSITLIPDEIDIIATTVANAVAQHDINRIVVSGGIGPTPDDVTLAGVAAALGVAMELQNDALAHIQERVNKLHQAGIIGSNTISEPNRRMAMMGRGAAVYVNPDGMAPLIVHELDDARFVFVLPGVPREFVNLVDNELIPRFFQGSAPIHTEEIFYHGIPESRFSDALTALGQEYPSLLFGSYPQHKLRELIIRIRGTDPALIAAATARLHEIEPHTEDA